VVKKEHFPPGNRNPIVVYNAPDGKVTDFFARENFWLPQRAIAELFGVGNCRDLQAPQKQF